MKWWIDFNIFGICFNCIFNTLIIDKIISTNSSLFYIDFENVWAKQEILIKLL